MRIKDIWLHPSMPTFDIHSARKKIIHVIEGKVEGLQFFYQ